MRDRLVYQTPIRPYQRDALQTAVAAAIKRAEKQWGENLDGFAFRVDEVSYAVSDEYAEYSTSTQLEIAAFPVVRFTPKGFHIAVGGWRDQPKTRWIGDEWTKKWASRTPEDALRDFIARRNRQANIYEGRAKAARHWAAEAQRVLDKHEEPAL